MASDPPDDDGLVNERERFVASVLGYWEAIREANARRGSASTRDGNRLVKECAARGCLTDMLRPLLTHDAIEVRSAAAAHLLRAGDRDAAVPVLQAVARHPTSMAAVNARMALLQHGGADRRMTTGEDTQRPRPNSREEGHAVPSSPG